MYKISEDIIQFFKISLPQYDMCKALLSFSDFLLQEKENGLNQIYTYEQQIKVFCSDFQLKQCTVTWLRLGYFQNNNLQTQSNGFHFGFHFITTKIHWICSTAESTYT